MPTAAQRGNISGLGEQILTLVQNDLPAGMHEVQWNARNLSTGLYFYRREAGRVVQTKKLVLIK